jgi:hypothetical protein
MICEEERLILRWRDDYPGSMTDGTNESMPCDLDEDLIGSNADRPDR